nr:DUF2633 family protein [Alkalicoccus halolimnae]
MSSKRDKNCRIVLLISFLLLIFRRSYSRSACFSHRLES